MNINKKGHNPCSSCGVCVIACPRNAITFERNADGFFEPTILPEKCTDCDICTKVCYKYLPAKKPFENTFKGKSIYGAWSKDSEIVKVSTSGGVGYELTTYFFGKGYKICGCIFDVPNNDCKHIIAETLEDLEAIRTSKYLQSNTIEAFSQFKKDEKYLVVGTPCQIYGLRKYIQMKKWEDHFVLVDFFCHGTPSFNLWEKYKEYLTQKYGLSSEFENVNFREKNLESKWRKNAISIRDFQGRKFVKNKAFRDDLFFKFFLNNSCLNDACCECKLRLDHCESDIRIADFWGIKYISKEYEWGVNLVVINTEKGQQSFDEIIPKLSIENCNFADLQNSQGHRFIASSQKREVILKELQSKESLEKIFRKHFGLKDFIKRTVGYRGLAVIKRKIKNILDEII